MTALKQYSADEVAGVFAGIPLEAESDDEFITIVKTDPSFTYKKGMNGFGTRNRDSSKHYTVTVNLPQTSPTNALLTTIHLLDLEVNGSGVAPLGIEDTNGITTFVGAESWIIKMPDWKAAAESDTVAWVFEVHGGNFFLGGN